MSISKWRYTEECNGRPCPGDCDHCSFEPGDLISRADAISIVHSAIEAEIPFAIVADLIKGLPSAEAVQGEWIEEDEYGDLWVCDQCGFANEYKINFCPNCGARMKGGGE